MSSNDLQLLAMASEIAAKYGLSAEYLPNAHTVGVRGDARSYLPTIVLVGPFPGWDTLEAISTQITNTLEIGKVTYELARAQKSSET